LAKLVNQSEAKSLEAVQQESQTLRRKWRAQTTYGHKPENGETQRLRGNETRHNSAYKITSKGEFVPSEQPFWKATGPGAVCWMRLRGKT